uniref:Mitochondrial thiamine pyrophosphate carrier n=1 Tax=Romanomermis culicivorax TaxID=13658 RepID=A0A915JBG4_ROMCU
MEKELHNADPRSEETDVAIVQMSAVYDQSFGVVENPSFINLIRELQVEPIKVSYGSKYHGVKQAFRLILREEGFKALWKGHVPAQALSISYGTVNFLTFEFLTKEVWKFLPEKFTVHSSWNPVSHFFCGALSGGFATAVSYPFDIIRTRLIGQGEPKGSSSVFTNYLQRCGISVNEFFNYANIFVVLKSTRFSVGALRSFVCGSAAGLAAKTLTYPLDLLKKRLQIVGFEMARQQFGKVDYSTTLVAILRNLIVHESYRGDKIGIDAMYPRDYSS